MRAGLPERVRSGELRDAEGISKVLPGEAASRQLVTRLGTPSGAARRVGPRLGAGEPDEPYTGAWPSHQQELNGYMAQGLRSVWRKSCACPAELDAHARYTAGCRCRSFHHDSCRNLGSSCGATLSASSSPRTCVLPHKKSFLWFRHDALAPTQFALCAGQPHWFIVF
jgi:hypothetical protein